MAERTCAPFLRSADTTGLRMLDAAIALLPAAAGAVWFWHWSAVGILLGTCGGCVLLEWAASWALRRRNPIRDGSALVTGMMLGLLLPGGCPWWAVVMADFTAVVLGKALFGGLGRNLFNPAALGRAVLLLVPSLRPEMLRHVSGSFLFGYTGGCMAEASTILLLAGATYLAARRLMQPAVTICALLATFFTGLAIPGCDAAAVAAWGGTLLAAAYLGSDPVTSPMGQGPQLVFGAGIGVGCTLLAYYGWGIGGTVCGILLMNLLGRLAEWVGEGKRQRG